MLKWFAPPNQLIKEDTPTRLILTQPHLYKFWGVIALALALISAWAAFSMALNLVGWAVVAFYLGAGLWLMSGERLITIDAGRQLVYQTARHFMFQRRRRAIPFAQIDSIYLDYEEHAYFSPWQIVTPQERLRRRWVIFLALVDKKTVTLARQFGDYPLERAPNLDKQTAAWEALAQKICALTGKLLVRTPSVPGRAPHTFVDVINQIVQRRLANLPAADPLHARSVRLRSHPSGAVEFLIDGHSYRQLNDIADPAARLFIRAAIEEWQQLVGDPIADMLSMKMPARLAQLKE